MLIISMYYLIGDEMNINGCVSTAFDIIPHPHKSRFTRIQKYQTYLT